ncbi:MAG: hypothetical protein HQ546_07580 [Planctomycetes bacterium]|nr:hypothetical protein [Planctomycetota bacterium]
MRGATWTMIALLAAAIAADFAHAQTTRAACEEQPTTTAAVTTASADPAVMKLLGQMEAAGEKFRTLTADVEYVEIEVLFDDKTTYAGGVYYQADPSGKHPARFRIHFDSVRYGPGRVKSVEDRDYVFFTDEKGQQLISRNGRTKQQITYMVAPPTSKSDPLKLGEGPFPMPFGQKREDVLGLYNVTTRPAERSDPKGTRYLKLTPRAIGDEPETKVRLVELWVNNDGLPVQIRTEDREGETVTTATFTGIKNLKSLPDRTFILPNPGRDWEVRIEPLRQKTTQE